MKSYQSLVPGSQSKNFTAHVFEKIDGQNVRAEYSKKRGWYKFGSRTQMIDASDPLVGRAVPIFMDDYSDMLSKIMREHKEDKCVIFFELHGEGSFCGMHKEGAKLGLTFFDFSPHGGIIAPSLFRKMFEGKVPTPRFLGVHNWTRGFVARVRAGEFGNGEGVVGKENCVNPYMAKAKTAVWLDKVKEHYGDKAKEMSDE